MAEDKKTFIITLKEDVTDPAVAKFKESIKALGGEIQHEYSLIKGFSVKLPSIHTDAVSKDKNVLSVEEDQVVKASK